MSLRRVLFLFSLIIFLTTLVLLITGSKWLLISLSSSANIPSGTFITWLGLIAFPLSMYLGNTRLIYTKNKTDKVFRMLIFIAIILAVLWVPISYLLADNISFTFSEKNSFRGGQDAMKLFWQYTYAVPIYSLIIILLYWIYSAFKTT